MKNDNKMTKRTKQAFAVMMGYFLFILASGVVVGALTGNVWWGLLGSVGAFVAGIILAAVILVGYAASRAYAMALEKREEFGSLKSRSR